MHREHLLENNQSENYLWVYKPSTIPAHQDDAQRKTHRKNLQVEKITLTCSNFTYVQCTVVFVDSRQVKSLARWKAKKTFGNSKECTANSIGCLDNIQVILKYHYWWLSLLFWEDNWPFSHFEWWKWPWWASSGSGFRWLCNYIDGY